jgi:transposase
MAESVDVAQRLERLRGDQMRTPDEVAAMLRLKALGWGERRIASEVGCNRRTVRRYLAAEGWVGYRSPHRAKKLNGLEDWLAERFRRHCGNADVVRQDLEREHGIKVSLRTVERGVSHLRQELRAEARATVRFETPPGHQLQIDFGEMRASVAGESVRIHLFVATLGYSRRVFVQAFRHERQSAWLDGIEGAFRYFGGAPREVLLDNARALVDRHDAATGEVSFNQRLHAFAGYWRFRPGACAPYRARTKGKDERGVGYVKHNGVAGTTLSAGPRWKRTWPGGSARSPTSGFTARRGNHRSSAFSVLRRTRCRGSTAAHRCGRSASWSVGSRPIARSSSTPMSIACRGD